MQNHNDTTIIADPAQKGGAQEATHMDTGLSGLKVMVIDDATVITGSFNFTKAAEQANAENLLVLRGNAALNALYAQNFLHHWSHSTPYAPRHGAD